MDLFPISKELSTLLSIICLALSAVAWAIAAFVTPVIKHSYWDGIPDDLVRRQIAGSYLNAAAALFAAAGVALQAYSSAL